MRSIKTLTIRRKPLGGPGDGLIEFEGRVFPCLLGKNGISTRKREGDWKTPSGKYRLLFGYWRADRMNRIATGLPMKPTFDPDGWCDAPHDRNYNRPVSLPYRASTENMKRDDRLYDIVIVMDHNYSRRIRGAGSAVFFHLTADKPHTAGCIAVAPALMHRLLPRLARETVMHVKA